MKKTRSGMLTFLLVLFTVGMFIPAVAAAATTVYVDPVTVTSDDCETVSVMIQTDEAAGIGSATIQLTYNPARVTYDSKVADGPIGAVTVYEPVSGTINMVAATAADPGPDGTFTFVELEFCPVGNPGECSNLGITVTEMTDGAGATIAPDQITGGEFCIPDGAVPGTEVYVDPVTVTSGDCETVSVMIQTDEAAGIGSATMQLTYNPARVTYDSKVADGPIGEVTVYEPVSGTLNMVAATAADPGPDGTFTFVELEFCPVGNPGECSNLGITVTEMTDGAGATIVPDSVTGGEFCIGIPPTVTVTYPVSGTVSGTIVVTADADDDPDGTVTQVAFYLMPAETLIGTDTNDAGGWSVSLDTTTVDNGDYQIKAVATDDEGATGENTGNEFAIDNGFCLQLNAGWNLVSVPKTIDGTNDAKTIFEINPTTETCEYYDACADDWLALGDIDVMPCRGYWVYKVNSVIICVDLETGTGIPPAQQLCEGWNMIGHIDTSVMPIDDGTNADFGSLTGLEGNFAQIWQWTQDSGWECCYPSGINYMTPGQGYWIYMTEDGKMAGMP